MVYFLEIFLARVNIIRYWARIDIGYVKFNHVK
jgi:hypothetical protein